MAIAYQSTSVSGASAAATGATAQSAVRDALVGHASGAWTLVEEFDSAGSTIHWVVLKCSTVVSGVGFDFYVVIGRIAATGQICMMVGEGYTLATHTLGTFAPLTNSSPPSNTILADFSYAVGGTGVTASFTLGTSFPTLVSTPLAPVNTPATTMRFLSFVEKDYAIFNIASTVFYIGAMTDLITPIAGLVAATPVGIAELFNGVAPAFGALTRHPIAAADAPMAVPYPHSLWPVMGNLNLAAIQRQALDTAIYLNGDRFQGNRVAASEIAVLMYGAATNQNVNNTAAKLGALRGKFKGFRITTFPIGAVIYDTVVVDGRKHTILKDLGSLAAQTNEFFLPFSYNTQVKVGYVFDTGAA